MRWPGGAAEVPGVLRRGEGVVVRGHRSLRGALRPGDRVLMDRDVFDDPGDLGIPFEEVAIEGELGPLPAWRTTGSGETVAVMLHGRGMSRREPLRYLPALAERGIAGLIVAYRGDPEAPPIPDGMARLGDAEWRDVEAAMAWAVARGARRLVLVGMSLGGGMALSAARRSSHRDRIVGLVLDGPFLQPLPTLRDAAERRGYPRAAARPVLAAAARRASIDLAALDQVAGAGELAARVLVLQGEEDRAVPVSSARALAERRPDLVDLRLVERAGHVECWNVDPTAHRDAVGGFLDGVLSG